MSIEDSIRKINNIRGQIDDLYDKMNEILDPLCTDLMRQDDVESIVKLIEKLPTGFHKTELRVYLNSKMN